MRSAVTGCRLGLETVGVGRDSCPVLAADYSLLRPLIRPQPSGVTFRTPLETAPGVLESCTRAHWLVGSWDLEMARRASG